MSDGGIRVRLADHSGAVVVEVSASWCGNCRAMAPLVEQLAAQYRNRVELWKVDADAARNDAVALGVRVLPTYLAFRGGQELGRRAGRQPRRRLQQVFEAALAGRRFVPRRLGGTDRILRCGAGVGLAWVAWAGDSPIILGAAVAAFASAFYDLLPFRRPRSSAPKADGS